MFFVWIIRREYDGGCPIGSIVWIVLRAWLPRRTPVVRRENPHADSRVTQLPSTYG